MLTERRIRDAGPELKTRFLWDGQVKNLGVRITPKGAKSYVLFYRAAGRKHLATLARCSEISLKAARERAGAELAAIRAGETAPLDRQREAREALTVNDLLDRFFDSYVPDRIANGRMTRTTATKYGNQADAYLRPALGKRPVADVTRFDVEKMAKRLARTPTLRNRVLAFASRVFILAEHWEWRPQRTNPVRGVDRAKEQARDRVLAPLELAALSAALAEREASHLFAVAAIRVAAMSGLRISECLSMRWKHVSSETGRVVLSETKTGRRVVPLAAPVLELLSGSRASTATIVSSPALATGRPSRTRLPGTCSRRRASGPGSRISGSTTCGVAWRRISRLRESMPTRCETCSGIPRWQ